MPEDIVYCIVKLQTTKDKQIECIFTDGHALDGLTKYHKGDELSEINKYVSLEDVYSQSWISETDSYLKRRKEAELLVKGEIPPECISGYVVYNEAAKKKLVSFGVKEDLIVIRDNYYF